MGDLEVARFWVDAAGVVATFAAVAVALWVAVRQHSVAIWGRVNILDMPFNPAVRMPVRLTAVTMTFSVTNRGPAPITVVGLAWAVRPPLLLRPLYAAIGRIPPHSDQNYVSLDGSVLVMRRLDHAAGAHVCVPLDEFREKTYQFAREHLRGWLRWWKVRRIQLAVQTTTQDTRYIKVSDGVQALIGQLAKLEDPPPTPYRRELDQWIASARRISEEHTESAGDLGDPPLPGAPYWIVESPKETGQLPE